MKITWVTFGLGWLAIIGVPPFSGFWSKDKIIEAAFEGSGWQPWVLGMTAMIGAGITAFYMTRLFFMTFHGERRWTEDVHPHESPLIMTIPMMVLAVGSAFLGLILGPTGIIQDWLAPVVGEHEDEHSVLSVPVITSVTLLLVAAGVALAYAMYLRQRGARGRAGGLAADPGRAHRPLPGRRQRVAVHAPRPVPHPVAGVRRQPGHRRRRQRARRRSSAAPRAGCAACRPGSSAPTRCRCSPAPPSWSAPCCW